MKLILTVALLLFAAGTITDIYLNYFEWMRAIVEVYRSIFLTTRNGLFFGTLFVLIGADIAERKVEANDNHKNTISHELFWRWDRY